MYLLYEGAELEPSEVPEAETATTRGALPFAETRIVSKVIDQRSSVQSVICIFVMPGLFGHLALLGRIQLKRASRFAVQTTSPCSRGQRTPNALQSTTTAHCDSSATPSRANVQYSNARQRVNSINNDMLGRDSA